MQETCFTNLLHDPKSLKQLINDWTCGAPPHTPPGTHAPPNPRFLPTSAKYYFIMENEMDYPKHVSIIMDGNGRWAKKRLLPRSVGHRAGAKALEALVDEAVKTDLKYLSVYAFSTENWKRDASEVKALMSLMKEYIDEYLASSQNKNVKLRVIGDRTRLDKGLLQSIENIENSTKSKTGLNLIVALNYGGKDEILRAVKKMIEYGKTIKTEEITQAYFAKFLDTKDIPDPELLIRTSGEKRISNFMLWQTAYSEIYYTDILWPDFTIDHLKEAIEVYRNRDRRFGG